MSKTPPIPVEKAITLTSNWRSFYAEIYNDSKEHHKKIDPNGEEVFRGFRIPLSDLEEILNVIKKFNEENSEKINSIRAYLVKDSEDTSYLRDIHVILLPVVGGKEIEPFPVKNAAPYGTDLLKVEDRTLGITKSVIYDFSQPCPTECDTESKLYSSKG